MRPWLRLVGLALLVKALLVALTLTEYGAGPDPLTALGREWNHWDAAHYLYLATHGYSGTGDARNLIAFFPLYPAVIGAVAALGLPARIAALLISNVAGVVAAIVLYELARTDDRERAAFRAAVFFLVFPTAYFLMVGYTEALFCALAFGAVLQARRRRWVASGVLGGLAAATRLSGVALLPVIVIEMFLARRVLRPVWQAIVPPLLVLLGLATYLMTNALVLGNPLAFVTVQREHWSHSLAAPWVGFASAIHSLSWRVPWEKVTVGGGEIVGGLAAYTTATLSWLRLRPSDAAYATALTVMVTFLPFWLSIPRYLLSLYPLFLLVGRIRNQWIYLGLLGASFVAQIIFGLAFGRGYWAF
jgi:4-amino-4-deoxy-L-arabinose transferase-like glycosyltransferase